jgi:DNA-binding protein YbaB
MNRLGGGQKLLGLILLPVVLGCGAQPNMAGNANPQPSADASSRELDAEVFSKDSVRRFLKYPDDASFEVPGPAFGLPEAVKDEWNDDRTTCRCSGKVKAKNALGAELTHTWRTFIHLNGDTWELVSCEIDGEFVYADKQLLSALLAHAGQQAAEERKEEQATAKAQRQAVQAQEQAENEERKWHKWTSSDGKFTVDAKFDGMTSKVVKLAKRDGTVVKLPLEKLSADDQEFIAKRKWNE